MSTLLVSSPSSPTVVPRPSSLPTLAPSSSPLAPSSSPLPPSSSPLAPSSSPLAPSSSPLPCPSRGFLRSLRVLYHILEEEGGGRVHVEDIEGLWGGPSILSGVPQALRDATASSGGYLSFPRLVKGLTQALRATEPQEGRTRQRGGKGVTRSQSINHDVGSTPRHSRQEQCSRRHTLTGAIDYNTLRQMKELEQQRDALLDGVQLVERARSWYLQRLHEAEQQRELQCAADRILSPPLLGSSLLIQVQEVNRFLNDLMSPAEKRRPSYNTKHADAVSALKHHNQLLTRELSLQNEQIWKLQRENEALYRELEERHIHRGTFI
ncbi:suppressor APC domain-containing protein 2-like [Spea bombifrons]|uniref:suppressor APC domain-containing protein 2-like n=1 Tax=Spea bombifrons TaxID=233779 RepID=UPI00234B0C4A|nr:suppressor APC domain-containing protein 2-like [Spea bombifrons]